MADSWNRYKETTSHPMVSDDFTATPDELCIVDLISHDLQSGAETKKSVIVNGQCHLIDLGATYPVEIYDICSEWGRDFFSYLGLEGARFELQ